MVMALDLQARLDHLIDHLRTDVLEEIVGSDREIPPFVAHLVAWPPFARGPDGLAAFDPIRRRIPAGLVHHLVKNKEFCLGAAVHRVGETVLLHVRLGAANHVAGVVAKGIQGAWLIDIGDHAQGRVRTDRVNKRCGRVTDQQHVAALDRFEPPDRRPIKPQPALEQIVFVVIVDRHRKMLPLAVQIGKFEIYELDLVRLDRSSHIFGCKTLETHNFLTPAP